MCKKQSKLIDSYKLQLESFKDKHIEILSKQISNSKLKTLAKISKKDKRKNQLMAHCNSFDYRYSRRGPRKSMFKPQASLEVASVDSQISISSNGDKENIHCKNFNGTILDIIAFVIFSSLPVKFSKSVLKVFIFVKFVIVRK